MQEGNDPAVLSVRLIFRLALLPSLRRVPFPCPPFPDLSSLASRTEPWVLPTFCVRALNNDGCVVLVLTFQGLGPHAKEVYSWKAKRKER